MARSKKKPNRLYELRKASRRKVQDIADEAGCDRLQLWRLENGETPLTLEWMRRLAVVYGVTTAEVLNPEDNPVTSDAGAMEVAMDYLSATEDGRRTIRAVSESVSTWRGKPKVVPFTREG